MSESWLYAPGLSSVPTAGEIVELDQDESRHVGSRRLRVGDTVTVFNGVDGLAHGRLLGGSGKKSGARVEVTAAGTMPEVRRPRVHLGFAVPKGDRLWTLLDMVTQVGADELTPVAFERSVAEADEARYERWRRILVEACKQARRPRLPVLNGTATLQEFIARVAETGEIAIVADPEARDDTMPEADALRLVVGPEGGLSERETTMLAAAGARGVRLGPWIQRVETACVTMCGLAVLASRRTHEPNPSGASPLAKQVE